jgi:putative aldouronate transport system permease protein
MLAPAIALVIVFSFIPTWGQLVAFFDYNPGLGLFGSPFVGLKHFAKFLTDQNFPLVMRNTIAISAINIIFGTVFPVSFGLLLNELRLQRYKKFVQTVSYLPHFLSYIVVANIAMLALGPKGMLVELFIRLGIWDKPLLLFGIPEAFWWLVAGINVWKETGWSAIIYISAMAGIDQSLYEAAMVDGAGRFQRILSITLPGIAPTIAVLFIMDIPGLLNAGFDPSYILGNALVWDYSEVIDTYLYRLGLGQAQYSLATAAGLMRMLLGIALIVSANRFARKVSDYSIY